ncbi:MAG: acyltransferase family protein [Alphaproteobacteria bacterium]|nr:acyltransferase family protein [Alphaproteobacteria bacterium]
MTAITPGHARSEPTDARRYDLDWLRVIAFAILIFYHVGMFYVSWDWHVKSVHAGPAAEWAMRLVSPWRLSLLFFISGVALRFVADRTRPARLAADRLSRLGLPILASVLFIVPPQSWLELVEKGEFSGGLLAFWPSYLNPASGYSIITPTYNHLWYVVYLMIYTVALAPAFPALSRWASGPGARLMAAAFAGRRGVVAALIAPALPHVIFRVALDPHFPTTHALVDDWANHAHSLTMFLTGYILAKDPSFWSAIARGRWAALGLAIGFAAVLTPVWSNWDALFGNDGSYAALAWPARIARVLYAWLAIAALLGLAQARLNRPGRALTYMTEAIFPWYILHQTLTVLAGYWLTRQGLGAGTEFALVALATIGGCAILHEVVIRRIGWLRPLFGLKPAHSPASAARRASTRLRFTPMSE